MLDAAALIEKYQGKGVLVDANLLVLYLMGSVDRRHIGSKRTENFTQTDFDLLNRLIGWLGRLYATPHVLSEVSNLAKLSGKQSFQVRDLFGSMIGEMNEKCHPSRELVLDPLFRSHGLADAAIAEVHARGILVLTADFDLWRSLQGRGTNALNFNHVRPLGW